jgi:hypothetical protein
MDGAAYAVHFIGLLGGLKLVLEFHLSISGITFGRFQYPRAGLPSSLGHLANGWALNLWLYQGSSRLQKGGKKPPEIR